MKDTMKEVEGKVKFSMADSTMMLLVQQAMDKAHENIKTKHGLLLRLNAISIFYELAVLQLESCLNLVQQETDNLESNHEEVVRDLRVIKDRLHHRLLETELAILEKDRELLERSENEESLRNVLESKETELVHLQDLERSRSIQHNKIVDFVKDDEFSELKGSVDKQVMNLRQKLETEYNELGRETEDPSGVDIDVLKGTMDLAFNKMHHAMFLSELGPIEQSWRWSIERDSTALLIKGFLNGLEEMKKKVMTVVRDYESGFKDRVCSIRREVECLESHFISQRSSPRSCVATPTPSSSSLDCENAHDDKEQEDGEDLSNYPVSKLIKSHESIIRRKSEELAPPKIEFFKRQKSSSKRAIDDINLGLDSLMSLNTKLFQHLFDDDEGLSDDDDRCDDNHDHDQEVIMDDSLDDVWMKMQRHRSVFSDNAVEEKEDAEMKLMILEDIYLTLLKSILTDEITNNRKNEEEEEEEETKSENIESGHKCRDCLENLNTKKDYEILLEDENFRQEVDWIVITESLREVSEDHVKVETNNRRMIEEESNRAFLKASLLFDDFDFKIQEKLKMTYFRLQNLEVNIYSTMDYIAESRRKESVYRTAFVLSSQNLIKAETEVDLLGDQVDSLVKVLKKTLCAFQKHPLILCNNSDISEISKMIKKELSSDDS